MKLYTYLLLMVFTTVTTLYPICDVSNKNYKEVSKKLHANRQEVFGKLITLYNPILNFTTTKALLEQQWDLINDYVDCGIRQALSFEILSKYSPDTDILFPLFDRARKDLQEATLDIVQKRNRAELKEHLNFLLTDQEEVLKVLNNSLRLVDKAVPSKIKPETIMSDYKNFYNKLVKFAAKNPNKSFETLNEQRIMVFLTHEKFYQDKDGKSILPQNAVGLSDIVMVYSQDPAIVQQVKNFAITLKEIIYALQTDTSFEIPLFGSKRSEQIKVLQKVVGFLEKNFGFDISALIPAHRIRKLPLVKDTILYCSIAEAAGLYEALTKVISYIKTKK